MKTRCSAKTTVRPSAGVPHDDSREGGAIWVSNPKTVTPRPSRTTSRPRRETMHVAEPTASPSRAAGNTVSPIREGQATPKASPRNASPAFPDLGGFRHLRLLAEAFFDAQQQRCAQENRFRRAPASKGVMKETGEILHDAEAGVEFARKQEGVYEKAMLACARRVAPDVMKWAKNTHGVGEHTVARLLGLIGHPAIAEPYHWHVGKAPEGHVCNGHCGKTKDAKKKHLVADPPYLRTVAQLWSYCGVGDPARKRRKNMDQADAMAAGSVRARTLVYLLAVSQEKCNLKNPAAYRLLYDERKADFAEHHPEATKKYCQNHALRLVGKEMLKHIWVVARKSLKLSIPQEEVA